ncbi:MAG TPA: phosphatase PAP2 family protein [Gemmatimonadales bacterium]
MVLTPTDKALGVYLLFLSAVLLVRGPFDDGRGWLLAGHAVTFAGVFLLARFESGRPLVRLLHTYYPLLIVPLLYAEIGEVNGAIGLDRILAHDATVQAWEEAIFGVQVSREWIRRAPFVFWSGLLHLAYLSYFPIVLLAGPLAHRRSGEDAARRVIAAMMITFLACYAVFILYPVAGPNYAFSHPTGPARDVWSAQLVYATLRSGSSVGAAFPSSHVAVTVVAAWAVWRVWRPLGLVFGIACGFLTVATVYCQMHYAVDTAAGLLVGVGVSASLSRVAGSWSPARPSGVLGPKPDGRGGALEA